MVPLANPIGRGSPTPEDGTSLSSATGLFRRQITTVSPASTRSSRSERWALASRRLTNLDMVRELVTHLVKSRSAEYV